MQRCGLRGADELERDDLAPWVELGDEAVVVARGRGTVDVRDEIVAGPRIDDEADRVGEPGDARTRRPAGVASVSVSRYAIRSANSWGVRPAWRPSGIGDLSLWVFCSMSDFRTSCFAPWLSSRTSRSPPSATTRPERTWPSASASVVVRKPSATFFEGKRTDSISSARP